MWLGPPYMYRKMTDFAFAAWCGFFGASGLTNLETPSAAQAWEAKKSSPSIAARATDANPPPVCQRNSRRVRPQKFRGMEISGRGRLYQAPAGLQRAGCGRG